MRTFKNILVSLALLLIAPAIAASNDAVRPLDSRDVAIYEKIVDTLESGGKVCQTQTESQMGSHLQRRPCLEGNQLAPEEWGRIYENLRLLKGCVAAAKPCMPRPKRKDDKPRA